MRRMILLLCAVVFRGAVVFGGDGLMTYHAVIRGISDYDGSVNGSAVILTVTNDIQGRFYRTGVKIP